MILARQVAAAALSGGIALALTACGGSSPSPGADATQGSPSAPRTSAAVSTPTATPAPAVDRRSLDALVAYDDNADLDLQQTPVEPATDSPAVVEDVSWLSVGKGRVNAWLVRPPATVPPPYAGLVYVHGSETDRDDFLDEAVAMAQVGTVSIVLDAPFARPSSSLEPYLESYEEPELERDMMAHAVVDVRQAYDVLTARPDVDPARLGYVGHSWGAALGVDVAAVDDRPIAVALLAPRPSWTGFLRESTEGWVQAQRRLAGDETWERYLELLAPFDALTQVDRLDGAELLFQYGDADDVVPPDVARQLVDAAPDGTTAQTFPGAGHELDDAATADRCAWLSARLALPAVPADVLATVGLPDE